MADFKKEPIKITKSFNTQILDVEDDCVLIFDGEWTRRIYFDMDEKVLENIKKNKDKIKGNNVVVKYYGDLKKPFEIEFLKIKKFK